MEETHDSCVSRFSAVPFESHGGVAEMHLNDEAEAAWRGCFVVEIDDPGRCNADLNFAEVHRVRHPATPSERVFFLLQANRAPDRPALDADCDLRVCVTPTKIRGLSLLVTPVVRFFPSWESINMVQHSFHLSKQFRPAGAGDCFEGKVYAIL